MSVNILDKVHKPASCLLLIALPMTETDFYKDLENDSLKDYAKLRAKIMKFRPESLWEIDHLPLVNMLKKTAEIVEKEGVAVRWNVKLKDFNDISTYEVVTLIAHYTHQKGQIELFDKLHSINEVVDNIDKDFSGILDLSVCNSSILQDKIKERFENQFYIKANKGLAELKIHLSIYKAIIQSLSKLDKNYLSTSMELMTNLNKYLIKKK